MYIYIHICTQECVNIATLRIKRRKLLHKALLGIQTHNPQTPKPDDPRFLPGIEQL